MNPLELMFTKKNVALLTHINPDWDCLGSALALRHILREKGVSCDIIVDEPLSFHLGFLDTDVVIYDKDTNYSFDCVCTVDVSALDRLGAREPLFTDAETTVCIDHHVSTTDFADCSMIVPTASATAEIVYTLMNECNIALTPKIGEYLYCALASDTGSFRYSNVTGYTTKVFGAIVECGTDIAYLANLLFYRDTLTKMKLQASAVNTIELYEDGKVGICEITRKMLDECGASSDEASALSALPRNIYTVLVSAVFKEVDEETVKVSLRSRDEANVERIAALFGGGGHIKAAGVTIKGNMEHAKALLMPHLIEAVQSF